MMGVRLFVGGASNTIRARDGSREYQILAGDREFTAAHCPRKSLPRHTPPEHLTALLDSGAFTDPPHKRLDPEHALERQLAWERRAADIWQVESWQAHYLVSYDLLIDETWTDGCKLKRRWDIASAEVAVSTTVEAARYLASQRERLTPRTLVLSAQGVDAIQYEECATEILKVAQPGDWFGLGGWCIIGLQKRWLPTFWQTLYRVLPRVQAAGLSHVHIFGVLWQPALGGLLWLADQHGLTVSTDSKSPITNCLWKDTKRSGARFPYWRDNVAWWQQTLASLRQSEHYCQPPHVQAIRQTTLFDAA
jgi:hypothetical protein